MGTADLLEKTLMLGKVKVKSPSHVRLFATPWTVAYQGPLSMGFSSQSSEGDGIPVELFQILKDDAVKVLHLVCQQVWKTQQWPQDWKRSFSFQSQRKPMPNNAQTTTQLYSSHMLVK